MAVRRWAILLAAAALLALALPTGARAGSLTVWACSASQNNLFSSHVDPGFSATPGTICSMRIWTSGVPRGGAGASFKTYAPAGITITGGHGGNNTILVKNLNNNQGFGGGFAWQGGGDPAQNGWTGWGGRSFSSSWFGFYVICAWSSCHNPAEFFVGPISLSATEDRGPSVAAQGSNNLFYQGGRWVRGTWPISFAATDPSGVCATWATINNQTIYGPQGSPNPGVWHQCPDQNWPQTISTENYGQGPMRLTLAARNAAAVSSTPTTTINVDNVSPVVSLSGPTDAPSTAGTQYITANAGAGPSGVSGVFCSLDDAPPQWYPSPSVQVPVQGIGVHRLTCASANNARDAWGAVAYSPAQSWSLSIRQPSQSTVSLMRPSGGLRCTKRSERIRVAAHWVTTRKHGRAIRHRVPARVRTVTVLRCDKPLRSPTNRVKFGAATAIGGWLGTQRGDALAGQVIRVLSAPDNASGAFSQVSVAITAADGSWSARLPAGPSRIIEAVYDGVATVEPSVSQPARLSVPASMSLQVRPRDSHWGATIVFSGRLRGGYIPAAGELVVLHVGWAGGSTEIGHVYAAQDGRFAAKYTFLRGNGSETYRFWATTAAESDYPYAVSASPKVTVVVSPAR